MREFDPARPFSRGYGVVRSAFSPAKLLLDGTLGVLVDLTRPNMLFADAGTTQAALNGSVRQANGIAGGPSDASQANAARRPLAVRRPPELRNLMPNSTDPSDTSVWGRFGNPLFAAATPHIAGHPATRITNDGGPNAVVATIGAMTRDPFVATCILENVDATKTEFSLQDFTQSAFIRQVVVDWSDLSITSPGNGPGSASIEVMGTGPNGGDLVRLTIRGVGTPGNVARVFLYPAERVSGARSVIWHHGQFERVDDQLATGDQPDNTANWPTRGSFTFATATPFFAGGSAVRIETDGGTNGQFLSQTSGVFSEGGDQFSLLVENVNAVETEFGLLIGIDWQVLLKLDWSDLSATVSGAAVNSAVVQDLGTGPNGGRLVWLTVQASAAAGTARRAMVRPTGFAANSQAIIWHDATLTPPLAASAPQFVESRADVSEPGKPSYRAVRFDGIDDELRMTFTAAFDGDVFFAGPLGCKLERNVVVGAGNTLSIGPIDGPVTTALLEQVGGPQRDLFLVFAIDRALSSAEIDRFVEFAATRGAGPLL